MTRWSSGLAVLIVLAIGPLDLDQHYRVNVAVAIGLSVLRVAPVLLALRRPVWGWSASLATMVVTALVVQPVNHEPWPWPVTSVFTELAVLGIVCGRVSWRVQVAMVVSLAGCGALLMAILDRGRWVGLAPMIVLAALVLAVGDALVERARARHEVRAQRAEHRAERERRQLLEERGRIARELHDVVAHHMSLIAVQAASAPYRISDLDGANAEFNALATSAREGLDEMRSLLGVLRQPGSDGRPGPQLHPQPGLADLDALIASTRTAGVQVRLRQEPRLGARESVGRAGELAVYRIVQEALSNVVRHAAGSNVCVWVGERDHGLHVGIANDAPTHAVSAPEPGNGGQGLIGMRERVAALGGRFTAGPIPGDGYRVEAWLPWT